MYVLLYNLFQAGKYILFSLNQQSVGLHTVGFLEFSSKWVYRFPLRKLYNYAELIELHCWVANKESIFNAARKVRIAQNEFNIDFIDQKAFKKADAVTSSTPIKGKANLANRVSFKC